MTEKTFPRRSILTETGRILKAVGYLIQNKIKLHKHNPISIEEYIKLKQNPIK